MPQRSPRKAAALAVATSAALAGCVHPGAPQIGIKPISADVVFGLAPKAAPIALPGGVPVGPVDQVVAVTPQEVPDQPDQPTADLPKPKAKQNPVVPACRKATIQDFAPEIAPEAATPAPTPGVYRFKYTITAPVTNPITKKVELSTRSGFEDRTVSDVKLLAAGSEFSVTRPVPAGTSTTRYRVRNDGVNRTVSNTTGVSGDPAQLVTDLAGVNPREVAPAATGVLDQAGDTVGNTTLNVGEPDRGLSVLGVTDNDARGNTVGSSSYASPLLLLPLPVTVGAQYTSAALDTKTLDNQTFRGVSTQRLDVDACGSEVNAWLVKGTLSKATSDGTVDYAYTLQVATQYGGLPIAERYEGADGSVVDFSLASPTPRPLPS